MTEILQKYRFLEQILPDSPAKRLVMLTGARQTGKTTLSKHKYPSLRYINLDAPENREALKAISSDRWGRDVGNSILDEVQKEPVIFEKLKYAFDEGTVSFNLLLGSSQILLLKKVRESLAGRIFILELWPLMLSEIAKEESRLLPSLPLVDRLFSETPLTKIFEGENSVWMGARESSSLESEDYLLTWGGMPALLPLSSQERWKWLKDYEYTYLERDLADLARLDDLEPFRKFKKLSALRSAKLLNYSELARDASVSVDTARRYLEYLRISYQMFLLQPYAKNITSSTVKTPKLYWVDVGLMRQLGGTRDIVSGEIYETMVVGEILKWIHTMQREVEPFFYRTRSGMEVDLLLQTKSGLIGAEIKNRETLAPSDWSAMKEVAKGLGADWKGGLVIYRGREIKFLADPQIWAVPSRRLLL